MLSYKSKLHFWNGYTCTVLCMEENRKSQKLLSSDKISKQALCLFHFQGKSHTSVFSVIIRVSLHLIVSRITSTDMKSNRLDKKNLF